MNDPIRIAVLSDSHGLLRREVVDQLADCTHILHAGDVLRRSDLDELSLYGRLYAVRGNCDFTAAHPDRLVIHLGGLKIYLTHGHIHRVKSGLDYLLSAAREAGADVALYGHTHRANVEYTTPWLINPGAAEKDCCALLEIEKGKPHVKLINLGFN